MTREESDVFNKYLEIKLDLVNNLNLIFNRSHTYTHKYRGNITTDINVSLDYGAQNERIIQIFVRANGKWVRDILSIFDNQVYTSDINTNILYNE